MPSCECLTLTLGRWHFLTFNPVVTVSTCPTTHGCSFSSLLLGLLIFFACDFSKGHIFKNIIIYNLECQEGSIACLEEYASQSYCLEMVINLTVNSSMSHCLQLDVHRGFLPGLCKNINWRPALSSPFAVILNETTCFKLNKCILNLPIQYQTLYLHVIKI